MKILKFKFEELSICRVIFFFYMVEVYIMTILKKYENKVEKRFLLVLSKVVFLKLWFFWKKKKVIIFRKKI